MTNTETQPPQGSPFWRFSLRFYREPMVADACIALQEQAGVDVNLLLFLLWQATRQRALSAAEVAALDAKIGAWRDATVVPLRAVRRALKAPLARVEAAEAFRNRIKEVELEAERLQQEAMYALAQSSPPGWDHPSPVDAARINIAAYETMRAVAFPRAATDQLLAAFAAMYPEETKGE
jgi:uncharacterized protein (TIGR02444 family)